MLIMGSQDLFENTSSKFQLKQTTPFPVQTQAVPDKKLIKNTTAMIICNYKSRF